METERPHAQSREIGKVEVQTPLIVPSFSSRGFSQVSEIWEEFRHRLYGVALVSSFDIAEELMPANVTDTTNLILYDSGLYETSEQLAIPGGEHTLPYSTNWTRSRYHKTVVEIDSTANVMLVNFDHRRMLEEQIEFASEDFSIVPSAARDFLLKPEPATEMVNISKLALCTRALDQFDVMGITAREAGNSLIKRCRSIIMLRNILDDACLDMPIHIFGAITPLEILTYYFCGADVFDGLNWLRLSFKTTTSVPIEEAAFEKPNWNISELDVLDLERTRNLRTLYRLQDRLRLYGATYNFEDLIDEFPTAHKAAEIADIAGAEIRNWR